MPLRKWIKSTNYAIEGILHAAKTQRHMRYHLYAAIIVLVSGIIFGLSWAEYAILLILAIIVISIEMVNTAIEALTDSVFKGYDQRAKEIKDCAAGAVLISALGAVVIGYIILYDHVKKFFYKGLEIANHAESDIAIIALIIVLIMVVLTKTFFGKGEPLHGGMPSGHAAVSFSIWVAVTLIGGEFIPSLLVLIMAILIAQSRVTVGIHRPIEVVMGALLGITVTFLLFKLLT